MIRKMCEHDEAVNEIVDRPVFALVEFKVNLDF